MCLNLYCAIVRVGKQPVSSKLHTYLKIIVEMFPLETEDFYTTFYIRISVALFLVTAS